MRIRLLVTALAYTVFLTALLLFPPFHDGFHHLYTWRPSPIQVDKMIPEWTPPDLYRSELAAFMLPDRFRLIFESLIGLVSAACAYLLVTLAYKWRQFRRSVYYSDVAGNKLLNFLFATP